MNWSSGKYPRDHLTYGVLESALHKRIVWRGERFSVGVFAPWFRLIVEEESWKHQSHVNLFSSSFDVETN